MDPQRFISTISYFSVLKKCLWTYFIMIGFFQMFKLFYKSKNLLKGYFCLSLYIFKYQINLFLHASEKLNLKTLLHICLGFGNKIFFTQVSNLTWCSRTSLPSGSAGLYPVQPWGGGVYPQHPCIYLAVPHSGGRDQPGSCLLALGLSQTLRNL